MCIWACYLAIPAYHPTNQTIFGFFDRIWLKLGVETKSKPLIEEYHKNDSFKLLEFLVVAISQS